MITVKLRDVRVESEVIGCKVSAVVAEVAVEAEVPSEAFVAMLGTLLQEEPCTDETSCDEPESQVALTVSGSYGTKVRIGADVLVRHCDAAKVKTGEVRKSAATWRCAKLHFVFDKYNTRYFVVDEGEFFTLCIPKEGYEIFLGTINDPPMCG